MTQRIFDIENEKDMQDLWNILPDRINNIKFIKNDRYEDFVKEVVVGNDGTIIPQDIIKINWNDKTEITRPIQEATEQDVGKLCIFWNDNNDLNLPVYRVLYGIKDGKYETFSSPLVSLVFDHARRLTKKEIEEIC